MRKLALFAASALLIASNALAADTATSMDMQSLAKSLLNSSSTKTDSTQDKGSFAIVYGGQDISRKTSPYEQAVLVG